MNNKPTKYKLEGQRFGHLYVIEYAGHSRWICKCDCGTVCEMITSRLVGDYVKSCGCRGKKPQKPNSLDPYVFECLSRYGNTVISQKTYNRLGEKAILKMLSDNGFDCRIRIAIHDGNASKIDKYDIASIDKYIIVEIIR